MNVDEKAVHEILDALREGITDPPPEERYALSIGMAFVAVCVLEGRNPQEVLSEAVNGIRSMSPRKSEVRP